MEFVPSAALAAALPLLVAALTVIVLPVYREWVLGPRVLVKVCEEHNVESYGSSSSRWYSFRALEDFLQRRCLFQNWERLVGLSSSSPKVFYLCIGKVVTLVVSELSLVREILNSDESSYSKPSFVRVLQALGDGLFSSSSDAWARQRPLILPALLTKEIKSKVQDMVDSTSSAVEKLAAAAGRSRSVDMHSFFLGLTVDVLQKTVIGTELETDYTTLFKTLKRYHRSRRELVFGLAAVIPGGRWLEERFCSQAMKDEAWIRSLMKKAIDRYRSGEGRRSRLTDILLGAYDSKTMTEQEVVDNAVTFLFAGHETTAAVLSWSVYLLALNPHWQQRAREEVLDVSTSSSAAAASISWEDLSKLKTIGLILMESVRLFPPQPLIGRTSSKENRLGDIRVPPSVEVVVPVAAIHRSEEYWGRDAASFRPDRFETGIKAACSHPLAYLPFGTGPRTCIGQTLAMTEAKLVLAMLLMRFSWEMSDNYRHHPDITLNLQPKFGMPVLLKLLTQ